SDRRHQMVHRNRNHGQTRQLRFFTGRERTGDEYRPFWVRQPEEVRIHLAVEDVGFQPFQHFGNAGDTHRTVRFADQIVGERRQSFDMVEMEMRQQDVTNLLLLDQPELRADGTRVNQHGSIDEKPAGPALQRSARPIQELVRTVTPQHSDLHERHPVDRSSRWRPPPVIAHTKTENTTPFPPSHEETGGEPGRSPCWTRLHDNDPPPSPIRTIMATPKPMLPRLASPCTVQ